MELGRTLRRQRFGRNDEVTVRPQKRADAPIIEPLIQIQVRPIAAVGPEPPFTSAARCLRGTAQRVRPFARKLVLSLRVPAVVPGHVRSQPLLGTRARGAERPLYPPALLPAAMYAA